MDNYFNSVIALFIPIGAIFASLAIYYFNIKIYGEKYDFIFYIKRFLISKKNTPEVFQNISIEYLEKRNEFSANFGYIIVLVIIITVLTVLLLTKTISQEAGLPIFSAVIGFAISKIDVKKSNRINIKKEITEK